MQSAAKPPSCEAGDADLRDISQDGASGTALAWHWARHIVQK